MLLFTSDAPAITLFIVIQKAKNTVQWHNFVFDFLETKQENTHGQ